MASCVNVISGGPGHLGVGYVSGWASHSHTDQLSACRLTLLRTQVLCRSFNVAKPGAPLMLPKANGCPRALPSGARGVLSSKKPEAIEKDVKEKDNEGCFDIPYELKGVLTVSIFGVEFTGPYDTSGFLSNPILPITEEVETDRP